jgi:uroporphyrinogen-III synthase
VIGVINVHHREEHDHAAEEIALVTFVGEQMGNAIAKGKLEEENARLLEEKQEIERELITRKLVERAKGILQRNESLTEEEAYLKLRNESRRMRRPMKELAEAIILTEEMRRRTGEAAS